MKRKFLSLFILAALFLSSVFLNGQVFALAVGQSAYTADLIHLSSEIRTEATRTRVRFIVDFDRTPAYSLLELVCPDGVSGKFGPTAYGCDKKLPLGTLRKAVATFHNDSGSDQDTVAVVSTFDERGQFLVSKNIVVTIPADGSALSDTSSDGSLLLDDYSAVDAGNGNDFQNSNFNNEWGNGASHNANDNAAWSPDQNQFSSGDAFGNDQSNFDSLSNDSSLDAQNSDFENQFSDEETVLPTTISVTSQKSDVSLMQGAPIVVTWVPVAGAGNMDISLVSESDPKATRSLKSNAPDTGTASLKISKTTILGVYRVLIKKRASLYTGTSAGIITVTKFGSQKITSTAETSSIHLTDRGGSDAPILWNIGVGKKVAWTSVGLEGSRVNLDLVTRKSDTELLKLAKGVMVLTRSIQNNGLTATPIVLNILKVKAPGDYWIRITARRASDKKVFMDAVPVHVEPEPTTTSLIVGTVSTASIVQSFGSFLDRMKSIAW